MDHETVLMHAGSAAWREGEAEGRAAPTEAGGTGWCPPFTIRCRIVKCDLGDYGPIIVAHGTYRGGHGASFHLFEDWESFEAYVDAHAFAGDTIEVWSVWETCLEQNRLAFGTCPAEDGTMPHGGDDSRKT